MRTSLFRTMLLFIIVVLFMISITAISCSLRSTVWNGVPPASGNTIGSQISAYLPSNGAYIQPGTTLSLSWSADGNLVGFIMTSNQFNNFRNNPISITSWANGSGSNGNISVNIQNGDTYYGVVKNDTVFNTPITLYKATLTAN